MVTFCVKTRSPNNWGQININFQSVGAEAKGGLTISGTPYEEARP